MNGSAPNTGQNHSEDKKLEEYLNRENVELGSNTNSGLRAMCWNGIPPSLRPRCWRLLLGHLSTDVERREVDLARKRQEYLDYVSQYHGKEMDIEWMRNAVKVIKKDVPRTAPDIAFFQLPLVQECIERILVVWAQRHPASGYVQGMNDLVIPFMYVFSSEYIAESTLSKGKLKNVEAAAKDLPLDMIEADTYWCFSSLLSHIQDHYTDHQPGIQTKMTKIDQLLKQVDPLLYRHLSTNEVMSIQFVFRYINCLFVREFSLPLLVRFWDTFICEGDGFPDLFVYVAPPPFF
eukprot:TRINITY_DN6000_c0_g1_i4.p1 TRINITY_DN6000_c0_g1~~TRINITY_DN6000_c0_g1_i4.p1  ORF type:complete len:291 (+),score=44.58 TRINITY_DN6000_c0_g1_i4:188-1060(+)